MTEVQLQLGGVDDLHFISLGLCRLGESMCHAVAVAVFSGASSENKNLFTH